MFNFRSIPKSKIVSGVLIATTVLDIAAEYKRQKRMSGLQSESAAKSARIEALEKRANEVGKENCELKDEIKILRKLLGQKIGDDSVKVALDAERREEALREKIVTANTLRELYEKEKDFPCFYNIHKLSDDVLSDLLKGIDIVTLTYAIADCNPDFKARVYACLSDTGAKYVAANTKVDNTNAAEIRKSRAIITHRMQLLYKRGLITFRQD